MTLIVVEDGAVRAEEDFVIKADDFFGSLMLLACVGDDRFMEFYFEILDLLCNGVGG